MRGVTEKQLAEAGIFYDQLILGIGGGIRYLINDRKSDGRQSAFAICTERDEGIGAIDI